MAIKHYKPITNGRRGMSALMNEEIIPISALTDEGIDTLLYKCSKKFNIGCIRNY